MTKKPNYGTTTQPHVYDMLDTASIAAIKLSDDIFTTDDGRRAVRNIGTSGGMCYINAGKALSCNAGQFIDTDVIPNLINGMTILWVQECPDTNPRLNGTSGTGAVDALEFGIDNKSLVATIGDTTITLPDVLVRLSYYSFSLRVDPVSKVVRLNNLTLGTSAEITLPELPVITTQLWLFGTNGGTSRVDGGQKDMVYVEYCMSDTELDRHAANPELTLYKTAGVLNSWVFRESVLGTISSRTWFLYDMSDTGGTTVSNLNDTIYRPIVGFIAGAVWVDSVGIGTQDGYRPSDINYMGATQYAGDRYSRVSTRLPNTGIIEVEFLVEIATKTDTGTGRSTVFSITDGASIFMVDCYPVSDYPLRLTIGDVGESRVPVSRTILNTPGSPVVTNNQFCWHLDHPTVITLVVHDVNNGNFVDIYSNGYRVKRHTPSTPIVFIDRDIIIGGRENSNGAIVDKGHYYMGGLTVYKRPRTLAELRDGVNKILVDKRLTKRNDSVLTFEGHGVFTETGYTEDNNTTEISHAYSLDGKGTPAVIEGTDMVFKINDGGAVIKDRSEIVLSGANPVTDIHKGRIVFRLGAGFDNMDTVSKWNLVHQLHQTEAGSPILGIQITNPGGLVVATRAETVPYNQSVARYVHPDKLKPDAVYDFEYTMRGGYDNDGFLIVTLNGVTIVREYGINIGKVTTGGEGTPVIPMDDRVINSKIGIYRSGELVTGTDVTFLHASYSRILRK